MTQSMRGSTDAGDLRVKAMLHDDWSLSSASGNIRIELPPAALFEVDAKTDFGEVLLDRDDIESPRLEVRHFHRSVNGASKQIQMRTKSGNIMIR